MPRLILTPLLKVLEREPRLAALHDRATGLLSQVGQGIADEARQSRDRRRYRLFLERRNEAFFHETWFTGLDLPANVQATRTAARTALGIFAESAEGDAWTLPALPASLTPAEQAEIGEGCYELLLVLAEAVAQPLSGEDPALQADRGLAILDRAAPASDHAPISCAVRPACDKGDRSGAARRLPRRSD